MSRAVGFVFFMTTRKLFLDSKTQRYRDANIVLESQKLKNLRIS